jgi:hypothetical protein
MSTWLPGAPGSECRAPRSGRPPTRGPARSPRRRRRPATRSSTVATSTNAGERPPLRQLEPTASQNAGLTSRGHEKPVRRAPLEDERGPERFGVGDGDGGDSAPQPSSVIRSPLVGAGKAGGDGIEASLVQVVIQAARWGGLEGDLDAWCCGGEIWQRTGDDRRQRERQGSRSAAHRGAVASAPRGDLRGGRLSRDGTRFLEPCRPGAGERDAPRRAVGEPDDEPCSSVRTCR